MQDGLPKGISARTFRLDVSSNLTTFTIRNGNLWGKNQANYLVYSNLEIRPTPPVKEFIKLKECDFFKPSPDGEHCYVKTIDSRSFIISAATLEPQILNLFPKSKARAVAWLSIKHLPKPYCFIADDQKQFCYFDLNAQLFKCTAVMADPPINDLVDIVSLVQFVDKRVGASFLIGGNLTSAIFQDETFIPLKDNPRSMNFLGFNKNNSPYFVENEYISISTPSYFFHIILDPKAVGVNGSKIYSKTILHKVDHQSDKVSVSNDIMFAFKGSQISFFIPKQENAIDAIIIPNAHGFEFDIVSAVLYSISDKTVTSYQFTSDKIAANGFDNFRYWLYFRLIDQGKDKIAGIILSQSAASFEQMINLSRNQSDVLRLEVFKAYLSNVKPIHRVHLTTIAICALDIYIRIESLTYQQLPQNEKESKVKKFIKWTTDLVKKRILTDPIIEKLLIEYDWNEALLQYLHPPAAFDMRMLLGEHEEAREQLKKIREPEIFCSSALRLAKYLPELVYEDLIERNDALNGRLIPLMMTDQYLPHLNKLFSAGRLNDHWLRIIFALYMSKEPNELSILQYFKLYPRDIESMCRALISTKHFREVANGMCALPYFEDLLPTAVGIAAYESPEHAFQLIPENVPLVLKRRCALRILRSMSRKDAEEIAKKLLGSFSGIDIATLIEFLPESATILEVSNSISKYSAKNQKVSKEEQAKSAEALKGIAESNDLVSSNTSNVVRLFKYHVCSRCGRPLLNETGIVYPCSHALHKHCAEDIVGDFLRANHERIELETDCPICGFLCIRMMTEPFEPDRINYAFDDPWSADKNTLTRIFNIPRS